MSQFSPFLKALLVFAFLVFPLQSFSEDDDVGGGEGEEDCKEMLAPIFSSFAGELKDVAINEYGPLCKEDAKKGGKEGKKTSENCKILNCLKASDISAFPGAKKSKGMIEGIDDMMNSGSNPFSNKVEDSQYEPLAAGGGASQAVRKDGLSQGTIDKIESTFQRFGNSRNDMTQSEAESLRREVLNTVDYYRSRGQVPPREVTNYLSHAQAIFQFSQSAPAVVSAPSSTSSSGNQGSRARGCAELNARRSMNTIEYQAWLAAGCAGM